MRTDQHVARLCGDGLQASGAQEAAAVPREAQHLSRSMMSDEHRALSSLTSTYAPSMISSQPAHLMSNNLV